MAKCNPDKLITSLDELIKIIKTEPSIYVTVWRRATSTAFIYSWSIRMCQIFVEARRFYTVKKE